MFLGFLQLELEVDNLVLLAGQLERHTLLHVRGVGGMTVTSSCCAGLMSIEH